MKRYLRENYKIGGLVRIRLNPSTFEKGAIQQWSNDIYEIKEYMPPIKFRVEHEGNEKILPYTDLQPIARYTIKIPNAKGRVTGERSSLVEQRKQLKRELNIERKEKSEDIKKENILEGKRERKPNPRYIMRTQ